MTNSTNTAAFSITNTQEFNQFADSFAKKSKLKPTHVKSVIANVRGHQTIASYKEDLERSAINSTQASSFDAVLEQISKAQSIIAIENSVAQNDLEKLKKLLPFFDDNCIEEYNYSSADQRTLDAIAVCQRALKNYVSSNFQSIIISSSHFDNDATGRNHYMNTIAIKDGEDFIAISLVTVVEHYDSSWGISRENPIAATLNGDEIDDLFFDELDNFAELINEETGDGLFWNNPTSTEFLNKAKAVIEKNKAAMSLLVEIEDF